MGHLSAERTEAHEVDGGLKDGYFLDLWVTGQAEADLLVASGDVGFEAGAVQVTGAAFVGEFGSAIAIPANEHAVVVFLVLIEQSGVDEGPDHLNGDAPLAEICEHSPLVRMGGRQSEGGLLLGRRGLGTGDWHVPVGGVPGSSMVGKQIIHRLTETLTAELLDESDGVPVLSGGIAVPLGGVLDAQAVHLRRCVVAADPLHGVAQRRQQARQVRVPDEVHLCIRVTPCCVLIRAITSFPAESKNSPARHPKVGMPCRADSPIVDMFDLSRLNLHEIAGSFSPSPPLFFGRVPATIFDSFVSGGTMWNES